MPPVRKKRANNRINSQTRQKIIHAVIEEGQSYAQASERYGLPYSTVRSIVIAGRETLMPRGGNRFRSVQPEHIDWLIASIHARADRTMQSLHQELNAHFQLDPPISRNAIQRVVTREAGYTLKMLRREPDDYNSPDRTAARQVWAKDIYTRYGGMDHFIYIDEAGFNLHIHRQFGRAPREAHSFKSVATHKGTNLSLLVAVDKSGLLASNTRIGAYNADRFTEYLQTILLPRIEGQRRVLLLDNARIHTTAQVREAVNEAGHTLLFLPPYSPHLNAAESVFSCVKSHVKKQDVQRDTLSGHILNSLNQVSREKAAGWIREVECNFLLAIKGQPLGRLYDHQAPTQRVAEEDPNEEESNLLESNMEVDEGGEEDAGGEEEEVGEEDELDHIDQVVWGNDGDNDDEPALLRPKSHPDLAILPGALAQVPS